MKYVIQPITPEDIEGLMPGSFRMIKSDNPNHTYQLEDVYTFVEDEDALSVGTFAFAVYKVINTK